VTFIVITQDNCSYCDKAKALMVENKMYSVTYNIRSSKWLKDLLGKAELTTVPQIWNSQGEYIGGYEELDKYIKSL
jgi:glutaredoxin